MMTFGQAVSTCFRKFIDIDGRAPRSEYWWFALFAVLLQLTGGVIDLLLHPNEEGFGLFEILAVVACIPAGFCVSVRRLHDINRSGWWLLLGVIPIIGQAAVLVLMLIKGTSGKNDFGSDSLNDPAATFQ